MKSISLQPEVSRRNFLQGAASLMIIHAASVAAQSAARFAHSKKTFAYVGSYTGAVGGGSNGEGIYLFEMQDQTGELVPRGLASKTPNPSWIAIHPSLRFLYAVNEVADFHGNSGSVSAFAVDPASGALRALNTVSSEGAGPAYLSIDATGKFAFVANYGGGSIAVLSILDDGTLGAATDIHRNSGSVGRAQATHAPIGSFALSGHDAPHAHMIAPDPSNRFVLATDLGKDRVYTYSFDNRTGRLTPSGFTALPSGDGPRHFAFHPNGHWLYAIQEEASTIAFFRYDATTGSLTAQQTVSSLPSGFAGTSFASEVLVSPNGRFLYAANRLRDSIAVFAIDEQGLLKQIGETSTLGDYPGQCRIDPSGKFLYACNRRSDNITSFAIHPETGLLTFTGQYTPVGSPGSITFLS